LKQQPKGIDDIFLAADPDREGEKPSASIWQKELSGRAGVPSRVAQ